MECVYNYWSDYIYLCTQFVHDVSILFVDYIMIILFVYLFFFFDPKKSIIIKFIFRFINLQIY